MRLKLADLGTFERPSLPVSPRPATQLGAPVGGRLIYQKWVISWGKMLGKSLDEAFWGGHGGFFSGKMVGE